MSENVGRAARRAPAAARQRAQQRQHAAAGGAVAAHGRARDEGGRQLAQRREGRGEVAPALVD